MKFAAKELPRRTILLDVRCIFIWWEGGEGVRGETRVPAQNSMSGALTATLRLSEAFNSLFWVLLSPAGIGIRKNMPVNAAFVSYLVLRLKKI